MRVLEETRKYEVWLLTASPAGVTVFVTEVYLGLWVWASSCCLILFSCLVPTGLPCLLSLCTWTSPLSQSEVFTEWPLCARPLVIGLCPGGPQTRHVLDFKETASPQRRKTERWRENGGQLSGVGGYTASDSSPICLFLVMRSWTTHLIFESLSVWLQLTLELVKMFGGASSVMRKLVAVVISSVAISELLSVWGSVGGSGKKWACCSSQSSIWAQSEGAFAVPGRKDHGCSQGVETNRHARSNQSHIIYAWV